MTLRGSEALGPSRAGAWRLRSFHLSFSFLIGGMGVQRIPKGLLTIKLNSVIECTLEKLSNAI